MLDHTGCGINAGQCQSAEDGSRKTRMQVPVVMASMREGLRCIPLFGPASLLLSGMRDTGRMAELLNCPVNSLIRLQDSQEREGHKSALKEKLTERGIT